jgi:hypothetical protein
LLLFSAEVAARSNIAKLDVHMKLKDFACAAHTSFGAILQV